MLVLLVCGLLSVPVSASETTSSTRPLRDGTWTWPLWPQPSVLDFFDAPDGPYAPGHRGVDLLGRTGQAVRAVGEGTVAYAGRVGGIGVVSLDTAVGRVTYQPVSASVRRGAVVHAGTVLGHLMTTGGHCVPQACLHLGLIVAGEYRDPLRLLGGGPVRLLPLGDAPPWSAPAPPGWDGDPPAGSRSLSSRPVPGPATAASWATAHIDAGVSGLSAVGAALSTAVGVWGTHPRAADEVESWDADSP